LSVVGAKGEIGEKHPLALAKGRDFLSAGKRTKIKTSK
jgi:hypothetical protein